MSGAPGPLAGDELPARTLHVTRADLVRYAEVSGDHNPVHLDDDAARALGLPGVVAHGMLTAALAIGAVAEWAGGSERVLETDLRFAAPVQVPAEGSAALELSGRVRSVEDGRAVVALTVTSEGTKVFGKAQVTVAVAPRDDA